MDAARNTQIVQDAYAAFGRGDIEGILDRLADNVTWEAVKGCGPHVPTAGVRHGKEGVRGFFQALAEAVAFDRFEPREFVAQGNTVVALGHYSARTSVGRPFASDWAMVFTIENDRIVAFREYTDSAALNAAFEPVAV